MSNATRKRPDGTIREATVEDVVGIVYVQATTWITQYPNPAYGVTEADIQAIDWHGKVPEWQHMVKSPDYTVRVAEDDAGICGFVTTLPHQNGHELYALNVLPEYQNRGLGSELIETVLKAANGDVFLQVASYNEDAQRLYGRYGFISTGARGSYPLPGGKTIPTIHMHRSHTQPDEYITRKRLAERSGVRESTIKWYTEQGLLPYRQDAAKRRRYYEPHVTLPRLEDIRHFREKGYSLEEIRQKLQ